MRFFPKVLRAKPGGARVPIAHKLLLSFLLISLTGNLFFTVIGITLMGNRILSETQERVRTDLNAAREIYQGELGNIYDAVRLTANRPIFYEAQETGDIQTLLNELIKVKNNEGLDLLTLTDETGKVILRTYGPYNIGDDQSQDELVSKVLASPKPVAATQIVDLENLNRESDQLASQAYFTFIETPMARPRAETEETSGMILKAAAPVYDAQIS